MKKENFCKIINALIVLKDKDAKLEKAFEPFFDEVIFTHTHEFQESLMNILSDEMNDVGTEFGTYISWWMWDAPDCGRNGKACYGDKEGNKFDLETPEQLYDFLRSNNE